MIIDANVLQQILAINYAIQNRGAKLVLNDKSVLCVALDGTCTFDDDGVTEIKLTNEQLDKLTRQAMGFLGDFDRETMDTYKHLIEGRDIARDVEMNYPKADETVEKIIKYVKSQGFNAVVDPLSQIEIVRRLRIFKMYEGRQVYVDVTLSVANLATTYDWQYMAHRCMKKVDEAIAKGPPPLSATWSEGHPMPAYGAHEYPTLKIPLTTQQLAQKILKLIEDADHGFSAEGWIPPSEILALVGKIRALCLEEASKVIPTGDRESILANSDWSDNLGDEGAAMG